VGTRPGRLIVASEVLGPHPTASGRRGRAFGACRLEESRGRGRGPARILHLGQLCPALHHGITGQRPGTCQDPAPRPHSPMSATRPLAGYGWKRTLLAPRRGAGGKTPPGNCLVPGGRPRPQGGWEGEAPRRGWVGRGGGGSASPRGARPGAQRIVPEEQRRTAPGLTKGAPTPTRTSEAHPVPWERRTPTRSEGGGGQADPHPLRGGRWSTSGSPTADAATPLPRSSGSGRPRARGWPPKSAPRRRARGCPTRGRSGPGGPSPGRAGRRGGRR